MNWQRCDCCGEPMIGIIQSNMPPRRTCEPCGGVALSDYNDPDRIAARRELRQIYAASKKLAIRCRL